MRIDLETIEKIEQYLMGAMKPEEVLIFENEIANNPELKQAVEQQKNLMKAVEKTYVKQAAVKAGQDYKRNNKYRLFAFLVITIALVIITFIGVEYLVNKSGEKKNTYVQRSTILKAKQEDTNSFTTQNTLVSNDSIVHEPAIKRHLKSINLKSIKRNPFINSLKFDSQNVEKQIVKTTSIDSVKLLNEDTQINSIKNINAQDVFSKFGKSPQLFIVSASRDIYIEGIEGTMIKIPARSLVNRYGQSIKGAVVVELKEFYKKSDFLMNNLHTMSNTELLESGGMIYISVKQNGDELFLKNGKEMEMFFKLRKEKDSMQVFSGNLIENRDVNWQLQTNLDANKFKGSVKNIKIKSITNDSLMIGDYSFNYAKFNKLNGLIQKSTRLGWINCDRFYNYPNKTSIKIMSDAFYKPEVRIVFRDINSIMSSYSITDEVVFQNVPVGKYVTILAFSVVDNEPYFATKNMVISKNMVEDIKLVKTSWADIELELKKLD